MENGMESFYGSGSNNYHYRPIDLPGGTLVSPGWPGEMVNGDHRSHALSEPIVVPLQLSVVFPHVCSNQCLILS